MDEGLRWDEKPKLPWQERVRFASISFGTGLVAAIGSQCILAVLNKQPITMRLIKQARNSGLFLGTMFAVGSQIQLARQMG